MTTLINGCETTGQINSNDLEIQNRFFEPVTIVDMSELKFRISCDLYWLELDCRWSKNSSQFSELWKFLKTEKNAYSVFSTNRINVDAFYHEKKGRFGFFYIRDGCFLKSNSRNFDHTFFDINAQEATSIDPTQRKLLETVYEAFESVGVSLEKIFEFSTDCFVDNFNYDHQLMQYRDAEYSKSYSMIDDELIILSNCINYIFNLKESSMTLDTACSSSMYALHLACSAIQTEDCSATVVTNSNLILTSKCQLFSATLSAVSSTFRCHTFDAKTDGYARANEIDALYIKRLENVLHDKNPIRAVIKKTAINALMIHVIPLFEVESNIFRFK